jgi:hypothetical protein
VRSDGTNAPSMWRFRAGLGGLLSAPRCTGRTVRCSTSVGRRHDTRRSRSRSAPILRSHQRTNSPPNSGPGSWLRAWRATLMTSALAAAAGRRLSSQADRFEYLCWRFSCVACDRRVLDAYLIDPPLAPTVALLKRLDRPIRALSRKTPATALRDLRGNANLQAQFPTHAADLAQLPSTSTLGSCLTARTRCTTASGSSARRGCWSADP